MSLAPARLRKGWCPGALRPMSSGDGLLLRVKPRAGVLSVASLGVIAEVAAQFGSGEIDLTNRANLQIRGLSDASYCNALAALDHAGLVDDDVGVEAVRNIVVDPLSGLDSDRCDVRDLAAKLGKAISEKDIFRRLPPKFAVSFSGVEEPKVGGRPADIMIAKGDSLAIWLDGDTGVRAAVASEELIPAVERLVSVVLRLKAEAVNVNRMRDAVARFGGAAIFAEAQLGASGFTIGNGNQLPPIGLLAHRGDVFAAGIGLPFGRIRAAELKALCDAASTAGVKLVHAGPQRVLVFAGGDAEALLRTARHSGLIVAADDPRLAMDVCPGSPACTNATTDTRRDAQHLVESFGKAQAPTSVHVSGCEKGCARQGAATITLIGKNGRYDIVRNGGPRDQPSVTRISPADVAATIASMRTQ